MRQPRSSTNRRIPRGRVSYSRNKWSKDNKTKESKPKKDKEEETITRASTIGGSQNEFDFVDTISSQPSYSWTDLTPTPLGLAKVEPQNKNTITSLKQLCALELTRNVRLIDWKLLDAAPWSIWKLVWLNILKFGQDSPSIYGKFAKRFHDQPSFKCHRLPIGKNDTRSELVLSSSIPGNRLHRFETIFKNVYFDDMIRFINLWSPLVILDLSLVKIPRDDYFTVFGIRDLVALNLCNHEIDNTFVGALCSSMRSGKLSKLKMLKINNTKITQSGLLDLFRLSQSRGGLSCVEADIPVSLDRNDYVVGTRWMKLDKKQNTLVNKLPLGLKLNTLIRNEIITPDNVNLAEDMILDIMMVDDIANDSYTSLVRIDDAWESRTKAGGRVYFGETFVLNRQTHVEEEKVVHKPQPPRKKQKRVQLNAQNFFCI
ncbi:hypothetical protein Cantr_02040 [Candida viswanathii]|uniref:Uncharacterized protein n=1 Tax=Candida viswanathii TaxID=5486 RepID=A0A367YMW2_9ASCO|nr:hypothetical protein Cantr_02040 [Candida viswanathii]